MTYFILYFCIGALIIISAILLKKCAMFNAKIRENYEEKELFKQWLLMKCKGLCFSDYFLKKGYRSIVVYGDKLVNEIIYEELKNIGDIDVRCVDLCDRVQNSINKTMMTGEEDVLLVADVRHFREISSVLYGEIDMDILDLVDVLYEMNKGL